MKIRLFVLVAAWLLITHAAAGFNRDTTALKSKPVYGKEARVIAYILDGNHYRKTKLNDSLSAVILDRYLRELDASKTYFTAADIKSFERYRFSIDDLTRNENIEPAFEIYQVFEKRFRQQMDYVMRSLVTEKFDYTLNEYYETDRDKVAWALDEKELNDTWRQIIKSQALSLRLAGKKEDEIASTLKARYERLIKSASQVNSEDVFSIYMNAITESYDPHTNYLSPKASDLFKQSMSLSLEGIGAQLQTENDYTKIVRILPGGPAQKQGILQPGDLITGVAQGSDGEMVDVIGWRIDDVVKLIKGPKGTTVRLQYLPAATGLNGKSSEITIVREKVKLEDNSAKKNVIHYQRNGQDYKLGVITLPAFYMDFEAYQKGDPNYTSTTRDVRKLIKELQAEGVNGLVMDLRNNGGGSLHEAVELTGLFIKEGPVVQVKNSTQRVEVLDDQNKEVAYGGPLVVLTNRFSASASEIFAGAIQDYHRGVVVGESTYGKGTVQMVLDLSRFVQDAEKVGELKITYQKFYRVTGSSTQHKGVTPDVELPTPFSASEFGESSNPNALPWDVIRGTGYQQTGDVTPRTIAEINKAYQNRLKYDETLKRYVAETDVVRENLAETRISLNEQTRRKEMAEQEARKAAIGMDTSVNPEGVPVTELEKLTDEFLRESLLVLSDLILKRIG
ncbi:MAG: carboxy terminal-processing peptidase [Cyclobacteriaceae bacterium]|nr:carboxy terminal-processing peptidase [Cyclobacteriaceae bacterium]